MPKNGGTAGARRFEQFGDDEIGTIRSAFYLLTGHDSTAPDDARTADRLRQEVESEIVARWIERNPPPKP